MKLQIIIPHYKETVRDVQILLDSISIQQGIDFNEIGVIIISDGPESVPLPVTEFQNKYPYRVEHTLIDHSGVCVARNTGLQLSDAEYVMFCDSDDMFYSVTGLYVILNEIASGFNVLISCFVEEIYYSSLDSYKYILHEDDVTFVHGKVYRRKYLIDNNISFDPELTIHEDSNFNIIAKNLSDSKDVKYYPQAFYLWRYRKDSVTRTDPKCKLKTYPCVIDSLDKAIARLISANLVDSVNLYICTTILNVYFMMNTYEYQDEDNLVYKEALDRRLQSFILKYIEEYKNIPDSFLSEVYNIARKKYVDEGMPIEHIAFNDYLEYVLSIER